MPEHKIPKEIIEKLNAYLTEKGLRKTEGRYVVLDGICSFSKYFDIASLHKKVKTSRYPVSKAMLYNTMDLLVDVALLSAISPTSLLYATNYANWPKDISILFAPNADVCTKRKRA